MRILTPPMRFMVKGSRIPTHLGLAYLPEITWRSTVTVVCCVWCGPITIHVIRNPVATVIHHIRRKTQYLQGIWSWKKTFFSVIMFYAVFKIKVVWKHFLFLSGMIWIPQTVLTPLRRWGIDRTGPQTLKSLRTSYFNSCNSKRLLVRHKAVTIV